MVNCIVLYRITLLQLLQDDSENYILKTCSGRYFHQLSIPWLAWTKTTRCCEIYTCRQIDLFVALLVGICWSCGPRKASGCTDENRPAGIPSWKCTVHQADLLKGRQGTFCL